MRRINKIPYIVILALIIVTVTVGIVYIIYLNSEADSNYNISEAFDIAVLGTENYGYANVILKPEFISRSGLDIDKFSYRVSKNNRLSNGEVITINVDNSDDVIFDSNSFDYQVSGLKSGTDLDIFKDLLITYDDNTKKILLDNSGCSEFIRKNVMFSIKRELPEYNIGDVVEIIAYVDMNEATMNRYNIKDTTYEYIVK